MRASPQELTGQAIAQAETNARAGAYFLADYFDVKPRSDKHVELCKALLPAFMLACSADFDVAMRHCYPKGDK